MAQLFAFYISRFFRSRKKLSSHCDNMVMAPRETNSKKNEISTVNFLQRFCKPFCIQH